MITTGILFFIYGTILILTAPLRLLPNASIPAGIASAISSIGGYIGAIDFIIPLGTIIAIFGSVLAVELSIFTYKVIMWVIRKIPTIS